MSSNDEIPFVVKAGVAGVGLIIVIAIVMALVPFAWVEPGERGVVIGLSGVSRTLDEGTHFKWPFFEDVVHFDVRVQKDETTASAASIDQQTVNAVIAVNYQIDSNAVAEVYTQIGTGDLLKPKVIDPAVQEIVKATTAKYKVDELLAKRPDVADQIETALRDRLASYNVLVTDVSIVNFDFSPSYNAAIEAKATAVQEALRAENDLKTVQFQADQRVAQAQAEAEAIKIQAEAITQQGGKDYVQLKAIEKWDGHLPTQMIPGSTVPFINLTR